MVCARCTRGACATHVLCARGACTVYARCVHVHEAAATVYCWSATLVARRRRRTIALRRPPSDACALRVHPHVSVRTDSAESSIIAAHIPKCKHIKAVLATRSRAA